MSISNSVSRFTAYFARHGFTATLERAVIAAKRTFVLNRMVVFYCDLAKPIKSPTNIPSSLTLHRLAAIADLNSRDLQDIVNIWNPKLAHREITERFNKGAALWLIKSEGELAGYSWTLRGRTIAPYYFLLGADDVQLFDFYVMTKFRGRAILWFLILHILLSLKAEGAERVFGDVAEWNRPSLSFYKMTPFRRLGIVRSFTIFGRTFVSWDNHQSASQSQNRARRNDKIPSVVSRSDFAQSSASTNRTVGPPS